MAAFVPCVHQLDHEISYTLEAAIKQRVAHDDLDGSSSAWGGGLADVLSDSKTRPLFIHAVLLQMSQGFSGGPAVFFYSSSIFAGAAGGDPNDPIATVGTILVAAVNLIGVMISLQFMDWLTRRQLMALSTAGMIFCCAALTVQMQFELSPSIAVAALMAYAFFFELGIGPLPPIIAVELLQDCKLFTMSIGIATQLNWAVQFLVGLSFPFMMNYLNQLVFLPFIFAQVLIMVYIAGWLPETSPHYQQPTQPNRQHPAAGSRPRGSQSAGRNHWSVVPPERRVLLSPRGPRDAKLRESTSTASGAPVF